MTLDEYLRERGESEAEFGRRIGRSQACVNRYRRGKRIPTPEDMRKIVRITRRSVTANDFYGVTASL